MKKLLFVIIALLMIMFVVLIASSLNQEELPVDTFVQTGLPTAVVDKPEYVDTSIVYKGQTGEDIVVRNFLQDSSSKPDSSNEGLYFLGNTFEDSLDGGLSYYVIVYDEQTGYFNIALLERPFSVSQYLAESFIKNLLALEEEQLCNLLYSVSVPGYVDFEASSIDYRFSFCDDSIPVPD